VRGQTATVHQPCDCLIHSPPDKTPEQLIWHVRDVVTPLSSSDETCGSILDRLYFPNEAVRH